MNSFSKGLAVSAGIFFVGYCVGQIPSNLCLKLIGAPWLTMILVGWGIVSALGCLINSPNGYIVQRLILGIVESGTFPGTPIPSRPHILCARIEFSGNGLYFSTSGASCEDQEHVYSR